MSRTHFRTYLTRFVVNLHSFEFIGTTEDQRGNRRPALGKQTPMLQADLTLFIGDESQPRDVGSQQYIFTAKGTTPTDSHKGLPPMSAVLPTEVLDTWLAELDQVIDVKLPFYADESEEAQAAGPEGFIRVNRLEVNLPAQKPEQHYIAVICGLYEDEKYQRQIVNASIVVNFVTPEYAERLFRENTQHEPTAAELATFMVANDMFDLGGFVANPAIQSGVGTMVARLYATLQSQVYQYSGIDVPTIMQRFAENLNAMYPAKVDSTNA